MKKLIIKSKSHYLCRSNLCVLSLSEYLAIWWDKLKKWNELLTLNHASTSLEHEIRICAKCVDSMQSKFLAAFFFFFLSVCQDCACLPSLGIFLPFAFCFLKHPVFEWKLLSLHHSNELLFRCLLLAARRSLLARGIFLLQDLENFRFLVVMSLFFFFNMTNGRLLWGFLLRLWSLIMLVYQGHFWNYL